MTEKIIFPGLHITLEHVGKTVSIGSFTIAYYGIIIAIGMVLGVTFIMCEAKRVNISEDSALDIAIYTLIFGVIGARLYYVIFSWGSYKGDLLSILNIRQGGLAIYGGILAGSATVIIVSKLKKVSPLAFLDVAFPGVAIGQIAGRWGNFFNREAFGQYSSNIFRMQLPMDAIRSMDDVTAQMLENIEVIDGVRYISVHPTFLYESVWNIGVLTIMLLTRKKKKFDGQVMLTYFLGYGIGRFLIEGLRTDQLKLWGTDLAVSQLLAALMAITSGTVLIITLIKKAQRNS